MPPSTHDQEYHPYEKDGGAKVLFKVEIVVNSLFNTFGDIADLCRISFLPG
jgi:hypothetical protein